MSDCLCEFDLSKKFWLIGCTIIILSTRYIGASITRQWLLWDI